MRPNNTERRIRSWLDEGPEVAPDDLIESVLAQVPATRRRPRWAVAGGPFSTRLVALFGVGLAALLIVAGLGVARATGLAWGNELAPRYVRPARDGS